MNAHTGIYLYHVDESLLNTQVKEKGHLTIIAQAPKMLPHIPQMITNVASDLGIAEDRVSVKATTTERLGFTGREEGISAYAVALITKDC